MMRPVAFPFVLVALVAVLLWADVARTATGPPVAARNVIYGVNDDNFRRAWSTMGPEIAPLRAADPSFQVGVWLTWNQSNSFSGLGQVPRDQPVMAVLLGQGTLEAAPMTRTLRRRFANSALRLVRENPNVREVQVWNEPDLCWWPCYGSERPVRFSGKFFDSYVNLLAAVHDRLRGTGVKVLGFGFSPVKFNPWQVATELRAWYKRHRHRRPVMDGLAYHPYTGTAPRWTRNLVRAFNKRLRGTPQPGPSRGLRLWWTETGYDSSNSGFKRLPDGPSYVGSEGGLDQISGTAEEQARRVALVARRARASRYVAGSFNFLLGDEQDLARWQSGLYYIDGVPKLAFYSFLQAMRGMKEGQ